MKVSKDGRPSGATNTAQSTSQTTNNNRTSATHSKTSSHTHHVAGSTSQRKSSQIRTGVHSHTKSANNSTSVKSRQNGGNNSSTSGNRASVSNGFQGHTEAKDIHGQQAMANYSQYGLVLSQQRRGGEPGASQVSTSNQPTGSVGANNQQIMTPSLKSAKQPGTLQTHQKTKSTHLTNSQGYAQFQAAANEGFNIYANNGASSQAQANSVNTSTKLAQKHSRHQSNPSWIMMQGGGTSAHPMSQQQPMGMMGSNNFDAQPNVSVQIPKTQQVTVTTEGSKPVRSKQINQSNAIVGGHQHPQVHQQQAHHQRFNSSKFGTQANSSNISKIQKIQQVSTAGQVTNNVSVNTTSGANMNPGGQSSSTINKTGGHKKSSSMANSKITQLLLKAGSKHYMQQQNIQAAAVMNQQNPGALQPQRPQQPAVMTSAAGGQQLALPQNQQRLHQNASEQVQQVLQNASSSATAISQDPQQAFVQSYEVPTRSNDMLLEAQKLPTSNQQVYSNINKSMDMAQQVSAFNNLSQQQASQQFKEKREDEHLQKILQIDQQHGEHLSKQELSYQEHLSKYLANKSSKTHHVGIASAANQQQSSQSSAGDAANNGKQFHHKTVKAQMLMEQQQQLQLQQQLDSKNNPMVMNQPMLFAQQLNSNQQINIGESSNKDAPGSKVSQTAVNGGVEKIARQGKVVSTAGVAVKKPSSTHVKNLSVNNQKGYAVANNIVPKQMSQQQKLAVHTSNHQRTKSDQVGSDFTLIINMGKVIQNQKGKVGEILKNNFIDAQIAARQSAPPGSVSHTSGKVSSQTSKQMRTYTGNDRTKLKNQAATEFGNANLSQQQKITGSQVSKTTSMNSRKPSNSINQNMAAQISKKVAIAQAKNQSKTIQEKYEELEYKYNELLEQLESKKGGDGQRTVSTGQNGLRMSPMDNILAREANQASLSSLSSKNYPQQNPQQLPASAFSNQQHPPTQMNPRMIRYINNQQKMHQGGQPSVTQPQQHLQAETLSGSHRNTDGVQHQVDNRSADMHTFKHQQLIDMSEMTISNPFDDGMGEQAPPNSKQVSIPVSSTASAQPQGGLVANKRKSHNRVNTHYYGQQIGDPHQKMVLRQNIQVEDDTSATAPENSTPACNQDKQSASTLTRANVSQQSTLAQQKQQNLAAESMRRRKGEATSSTGQIQQTNNSSQQISGPGHSHTRSHTGTNSGFQNGASGGATTKKQSSNPQQNSRYHQQNGKQQASGDLTTSKTQQTPRMTSASAEQVEKIALQHQHQQMRLPGVSGGAAATGASAQKQSENLTTSGNVGKHTRMLWQNLVSVSQEKSDQIGLNLQSSNAAAVSDLKSSGKYTQVSAGGNHRRSVSDGNNPSNNFNFKQQASGIIMAPASITDQQQRENQATTIGQQSNQQAITDISGKQTLSQYSMHQRKRIEQQQLLQQQALQQQTQQAITKSTTRSHSRSKGTKPSNNTKAADLTVGNVHPADITSLESADNHHHPNSQLVFAQVGQDRKTTSGAGGKTNAKGTVVGKQPNPQQSLSKDSFVSKKIQHIKKSQKNVVIGGEGRSSSNGPLQNNVRTTDVQKKTQQHTRMKSNSYRHSNKDSSLMGATTISNNDPSNEGQIQNPSTAVINGRFIDMAQGQQPPPSKVMIKRGVDVSFSIENQYTIEMQTKEHQAQYQQQQQAAKNQSQASSKRAFHHPTLSQPNPWVPNIARSSQEMFIVQENTSSTHSVGQGDISDEGGKVKLVSHGGGNNGKGVRANANGVIGLSPVIGAKTNKPQMSNLLKSQGPPASAYSNEQQSNLARGSNQDQQFAGSYKKDSHGVGVVLTKSQGKDVLTIERKRAAVVKNQASKHPICQGNATGHIKNKLSNNSEERQGVDRIPVAAMSQKHKRHKSDNVENHSQFYQPLIARSHDQTGEKNSNRLPQKAGGPFNHNPRKDVKTAQISPNTAQKASHLNAKTTHSKGVFIGGDAFYAENDKASDKKLVNISIDELNDMPSDVDLTQAQLSAIEKERTDRSKWIEVIRENSQPSQNQPPQAQVLHQHIVQQYEQSQKRDQQINEKRKKFMQAYQVKSDALNRGQEGHQASDTSLVNDNSKKQIVSKQRVSSHHPQNVMLIEERHSTEELPSHQQSEHNAKYKNIYSIAKRKFKSKSYVPPHIQMKNSHSSIEQDSSARNDKISSAEDLQKLNYKQQYEGIPADSFQESQRKISININIPNEIQNHQDKLREGYPNCVSQRSLADSDQKQHRAKSNKQKKTGPLKQSLVNQNQQQLKENQARASKEVLAPLHSLELQNFRGIQLTTPPEQKQGLKAPKASVQKNNFLPEDKNGGVGQTPGDMRIETYSSIEHDSELTAKEKTFKKICKYVRLGFSGNGQVPLTTVDFYRVGKILGKGAFGKVNLALHHLTQHMVAIKSINKQYFGEDSQRRKVLQEVVILKQTRHKHIVRLYEFFETQKHILFVIEIAAGGDLLNYVRKRRQLKEDVAKSVFKQVISGLHYCHSKGILHRDIKLDNILLSNNGEVKICDFGVSKVIRRGEIMTEQCGTPAYIAPEILKDRGYEGFGVDIWSSGVVLYAMLYGIVPFRANNMNELQKMIIRADYKLQDCISKEARDILTGLLEKDPAKRLTTRQIMAHPWMVDARDTVELFTQAEKNYIKSEYTYNDSKRYNRNMITGNQEYESDAFVDAMLDTNENSILKNAETKSVILAPFNSTKSHIETGEEFLELVRDQLEDHRIIKFAPRVREIAKQYEVNNNAELDNGVQHDFLEEEAKAKAAAEEEKQGAKPSEMNLLDQLIKQEESLQMSAHGGDDVNLHGDSNKHLDPYSASEDVGDNSNRLTPDRRNQKNGNKLASNEIGEAENSLAPMSKRSQIQAQQTLMIDENIIERLLDFGYPREAVVQCLNKNELNNATTAYWLIQMAQQMAIEEAASAATANQTLVEQQRQTSASRSEH